LIAAGVLALPACIHGSENSVCGGHDALLEAAFRFQFTHNHSALKNRAAVFFIGIGEHQDPDEALLERFSGHVPPVRAISEADTSGNRVIDPASGRAALIFRIDDIRFDTPRSAIMQGGYLEGVVSASWITLQGKCRAGTWIVSHDGPEKLS